MKTVVTSFAKAVLLIYALSALLEPFSLAQSALVPQAGLPKIFNSTTCADMGEDQVSELPTKLIPLLPQECLSQLNFSCSGFSPDQLRAIPPNLLATLQPFCISNIRSSSWSALSEAQLRAMTVDQCEELAWHIQDVPPESLRGLSVDCFSAWRQWSDIGSFPLGCAKLTSRSVVNLSPSLFAVMTVECLHNLQRDAISALSVDQIRSIPPLVAARFTATLSALPEPSFAGFSITSIQEWPDYTVASLSASQLFDLVKGVGPAILDTISIHQLRLSPVQTVIAFKRLVAAHPDVLQNLNTDFPVTKISEMSWLKLLFSKPDRAIFSSIGNYSSIPLLSLRGLSARHAPVMNESIWSSITRQQAPYLLPDFIAAASETQFLSITGMAMHYMMNAVWPGVPPKTLSHLSPIQVKMINPPAFSLLSCQQLRAFTPEQFAASPAWIKETFRDSLQRCDVKAQPTTPPASVAAPTLQTAPMESIPVSTPLQDGNQGFVHTVPVATIVSIVILLFVAGIVAAIYVKFLKKRDDEYEIVMS